MESLYGRYNHRNLIKPDPLGFVYRYSSRADMEVAGLVASMLAYGRVEQIQKSLNRLFDVMGSSPFDFVINFNDRSRRALASFKHRFTSGDCLSDLFELLRPILEEYETIENYFLAGYSENDKNIIPALSKFCDSLLKNSADNQNGLSYLLPRPENGSACKRLNLFLRWMVRDDDVDTGLWKSVDKAKLVVPIDVHMGRLCRLLGLYSQKTVSLSAAIKITDSFTEIMPDDPVKYDFALSRIGIIENCTGSYRDQCDNCQLNELCSKVAIGV